MWFKDLAELAIFVSCLLSVRAAGPVTIAPGAGYTEYTVPGPNRVYVVAIERGRREYSFAIGWPGMVRNFSDRQATSRIAALYDQPPHHDVVAAVNASFFGAPPNVTGATASYGELQEMPDGARDTLVIAGDGVPRIIEDVCHAPGVVVLDDGTMLPVDEYNRGFATGKLIAYTEGWGTFRSAREDLTAVVLGKVARPTAAGRPVTGVVREIHTDLAAVRDLPVGSGELILAADCETGEALRRGLRVGSEVVVWFAVRDERLAGADLAVTGVGWIVRHGRPHRANWKQYAFSTVRHPRTVFAWNESHYFMLVIDGRSLESVGMTFAEMADFLTTVLHADEALNLDGGGSSTMVVDGVVKNAPSDGSERAVANALLVVRDAAHGRE